MSMIDKVCAAISGKKYNCCDKRFAYCDRCYRITETRHQYLNKMLKCLSQIREENLGNPDYWYLTIIAEDALLSREDGTTIRDIPFLIKECIDKFDKLTDNFCDYLLRSGRDVYNYWSVCCHYCYSQLLDAIDGEYDPDYEDDIIVKMWEVRQRERERKRD